MALCAIDVLFALLLLKIVTTATFAATISPTQLPAQNIFDACPKTPTRTDVYCNGKLTGSGSILGVARLTCGSYLTGGPCSEPGNSYVYVVGVTLDFSAQANVTCYTNLTWSVIPVKTTPSSSAILNCNSVSQCTVSQIKQPSDVSCKEIFLKNISVTIAAPTYMRLLEETGVEFPYTYVNLMREKTAGVTKNSTEGYFVDSLITNDDAAWIQRKRTLQSQLFLQNDDADDNYKRCMNDVLFEQGLRTRGCCTNKPVVNAANDGSKQNSRAFDCTQDFVKNCCAKNENGCPGNRVAAFEGGALDYCNANTDKNNNVLNFLSSTSSCWSLDGSQSNDIAAYEYSPITNIPDTSYSCCKNPVCPGSPCVGSAPCGTVYCANEPYPERVCNKLNNRYIFPKWTPLDTYRRYVGVPPYVDAIKDSFANAALRRVPMSCDIQASTRGILAKNTTWLPLYAINDIYNAAEAKYYASLLQGSDVPVVRREGVWRTITQHRKVRALICGRCAQLQGSGGCQRLIADPVAPFGKSCCGGKGKWPNPSLKLTYPTIWAEKNWVLGSSPTCKTYQPKSASVLVQYTVTIIDATQLQFSLGYSNAQETIYEQSSVNRNIALVSAPYKTEANGLLLCDPYQYDLPKDASILEATGQVVLCEPATGLAQKRFDQFGPSNPWNPVKCANGICLPDAQTNGSEFAGSTTSSPTMVYYIRPEIQKQYALKSDYGSGIDQTCGRNGFSDEIFTNMDDGDQLQLFTPVPFMFVSPARYPPVDAPVCSDLSASKAGINCACWESSGSNNIYCPCAAGKTNVDRTTDIGRTQTALCIQQAGLTTLCRPSFTSAKAASLYENLRQAINSKSSATTQQRAAVRNSLLPSQWRDEYPNFWLGTDKKAERSTKPLALYYQSRRGAEAGDNPECKTVMQSLVMVGNNVVQEVPDTPTGYLRKTQYCPCRSTGDVVTGVMYLTYEPDYTAYQTTGFPFKVSISWLKASCTVTGGASVTVKNNGGAGTPVSFQCTIGKDYTTQIFGELSMTAIVASSSLQVPKVSTFLLYSCACTAKYAQVNDPKCTLTNNINGVVFGLNQKSTTLSCPPPPPATGSTEGTNPTAMPSPIPCTTPTPGTAPVPGASTVPSSTPSNPPPPFVSVSPTKAPTEEDAQNSQGTGTEEDQDWTIYFIVGGSIAGLVAIVAAIGIGIGIAVYCSRKNKRKQNATKRKPKTE